MEEHAEELEHRNVRGLKRRHLIYYLRVYDESTHHILGHLVDINANGIMLISDSKTPVGKEYRLCMKFPGAIEERKELIFDAVCRWCRKDVNPSFHIAGFELVHFPPEDEEFITQLIEDFGFQDS